MPAKKTTTKETEPKGFTADGYTVPAGEEASVHVEIEDRLFRQEDGVRMSKAKVQKFNPVQFKRFYQHRAGTKINKLLHMPPHLNPDDFPADPDPRNGK